MPQAVDRSYAEHDAGGVDRLEAAVGRAARAITQRDARAYIKHYGYSDAIEWKPSQKRVEKPVCG